MKYPRKKLVDFRIMFPFFKAHINLKKFRSTPKYHMIDILPYHMISPVDHYINQYLEISHRNPIETETTAPEYCAFNWFLNESSAVPVPLNNSTALFLTQRKPKRKVRWLKLGDSLAGKNMYKTGTLW